MELAPSQVLDSKSTATRHNMRPLEEPEQEDSYNRFQINEEYGLVSYSVKIILILTRLLNAVGLSSYGSTLSLLGPPPNV